MSATMENELESLHEFENEFEALGELGSHEFHELHEIEGEFGGHNEFEFETEGELEWEGEISPVRKVYADGMMEHLAHLAAESESEYEAAEHFLPLIGLAAKKLLPVVAKAVAPKLRSALPRIARAVTGVEPRLTQGIARIARGLHRSPGMRPLLHAVPAIARRTVGTIARQAAHGTPVTPRSAVRTLANQARMVLLRPRYRHHALRRSRIMDGRLHRHMPGVVRPHGWRSPGYGIPGARWGMPRAGRASWGVGAAAGPQGQPWAGAAGGPGCQCHAVHCRCCGQVVR